MDRIRYFLWIMLGPVAAVGVLPVHIDNLHTELGLTRPLVLVVSTLIGTIIAMLSVRYLSNSSCHLGQSMKKSLA